MENLLIKVYKNRKTTLFLTVLCQVLSVLFVLFMLFLLGFKAYKEEYLTALMIAVCAGVGFVMVTLLRHFIDAPRPYELYSFYEVKPKEKSGKSFPSRHAYSAFAISTLAFSVSPLIATVFLFLAAIMCVCRVLLGIHFIRDVAAGALIGAVAGIIGLILI